MEPSAPLFSQRLRLETRRSHSLAEKAGFIRGFLGGVVDVPTYARLLAGYQLVYAAMEDAMELHRDHPLVGAFDFPGLARSAPIATDLAYFSRAAWPRPTTAPAAARRYAQHITSLAEHSPELLVAHFYTRYLGDVSGGQILKKILRSSLDLPTGIGSAFYEFPDLGDLAAFKREFRARLDRLPIGDATRDAIVAEANHTFRLNVELFDELEGNHWTTVVQLIARYFRPESVSAASF